MPRRAELLLWTALAALFVYHALHFSFVQDDSFITFRYVRNLVNGNGLVFNIGERVEGYTTFLWTILLAVPALAGIDLIAGARWLGIAAGAGSLFFLWQLSRRVTRAPVLAAVPAIAVLLTVSNSSGAYWTVSGMETPLFTLFLVAGAWVYLRELQSQKRFLLTPCVFVLLSLTRPEGVLLYALTGLHYATVTFIVRRSTLHAERERLATFVGLFAAPIALFMAWRLSYYGYLFPNTYYAKAGFSAEYLRAGWDYAVFFARTYMLDGALIGAALAVVLWKRRSAEILYLIVLTGGYCAYVVSVGGDVLHAFRFFVPVLPFLYLIVQEALAEVARLFPKSRAAQFLPAGAAAALAYMTFTAPYDYVREKWMLENGLVDKMTQTGQWLGAHADDSTVVAASTIGALSYYSGVPLIDMLGLTDATIAHHPEAVEGIQSGWKERKYNTTYLLSRRPAWIFFSTGVKPSAFAERALFTRAEFRRFYYPTFFHLAGDPSAVNVAYRRSPVCLVDTLAFPDAVREVAFINEFYDGMNRRRTPQEALRYYTRALGMAPPDFALLRQEIGSVYLSLQDHARAEQYFRDAVRINPAMVESQLMLGYYAQDRKQYTEAAARFSEVIRYDPEYAAGWFLRAQAATMLGDTAAAVSDLRQALQITPGDTRVAGLLSRLVPRM